MLLDYLHAVFSNEAVLLIYSVFNTWGSVSTEHSLGIENSIRSAATMVLCGCCELMVWVKFVLNYPLIKAKWITILCQPNCKGESWWSREWNAQPYMEGLPQELPGKAEKISVHFWWGGVGGVCRWWMPATCPRWSEVIDVGDAGRKWQCWNLRILLFLLTLCLGQW